MQSELAQSCRITGAVMCVKGLVYIAFVISSLTAFASQPDPELYRRGYASNFDLDAAIAEYNTSCQTDFVAKQYPALRASEIKSKLAKALRNTLASDKRRRDRIRYLLDCIERRMLPKGSLITFQYASKSRTVYTHDWGKLSNKFAIILFSGLNENPPGIAEFNDDAFIIGITIRSGSRKDKEFEK